MRCLACNQVLSQKTSYPAKEDSGAKNYLFHECGICGSLNSEYVNREKLYDNRDSTNYAETAPFILRYLKEIFLYWSNRNILNNLDRNDQIVDFGCGSGEFSNMLVSRGFKNILAADLQIERPENLESSVKYYCIGELTLTDAKIIVARHVFEHIENPIETLEDFQSKIPQNCKIIIEVPNASSIFRLVLKRRWPGYYAPYHTIVFSRKGLSLLSERAGFFVTEAIFKESPIVGYYLCQLGMPRTLSRALSATLFPIQFFVSKICRSGEAIQITIEK